MSCFVIRWYSWESESMIDFSWQGIDFEIAALGGGVLKSDIGGHIHSKNSYELHFITGGKGTLITESAEYQLKAGDFFVTGPGVYHAQGTDPLDFITDYYIYFQITRMKETSAFAAVFLNTGFWISENFDSSTAKEIVEEFRSKRAGYKSAVAGLMMKLLTDITRCYCPSDFSEAEEAENLNDKRFILIENAFLYNPDLTLQKLSETIGVCPRQTQRLLKKYYGKSFREKKREITRKKD